MPTSCGEKASQGGPPTMTTWQVPQGGATTGMQIAHQCSPWGQAVAETISWLAFPSSSWHPFSGPL